MSYLKEFKSFSIRASLDSVSTKGNHGEECSRAAFLAAEWGRAQRADILINPVILSVCVCVCVCVCVNVCGWVHLSAKTDTLHVTKIHRYVSISRCITKCHFDVLMAHIHTLPVTSLH